MPGVTASGDVRFNANVRAGVRPRGSPQDGAGEAIVSWFSVLNIYQKQVQQLCEDCSLDSLCREVSGCYRRFSVVGGMYQDKADSQGGRRPTSRSGAINQWSICTFTTSKRSRRGWVLFHLLQQSAARRRREDAPSSSFTVGHLPAFLSLRVPFVSDTCSSIDQNQHRFCKSVPLPGRIPHKRQRFGFQAGLWPQPDDALARPSVATAEGRLPIPPSSTQRPRYRAIDTSRTPHERLRETALCWQSPRPCYDDSRIRTRSRAYIVPR